MTAAPRLHPPRAPDPATRWPDGAKTIVSVTIHIDGPAVEAGQGLPPAGIHSRGRYSMRRGIPRYLDMLARHGIPASFFACGYDVEHYPAPHRDILAAGHEIAAHGYQHEAWDLGDNEPTLLEKTHRIIQDKLGISPVGWCSPSGRKSARTIPTLQRLGYIYDASEKDLDEPYLLGGNADERATFVTLPNNTVSLDDAPVYNMGQALPDEIYENWVAEFEAIRKHEGYVQLTVHPKAGNGSGTPARARTVDRFFTYLKQAADVRFVTMQRLAEHCLQHQGNWSTMIRSQENPA
ncbi:polysaccharide deacetylase family protein [Bordetella sp. N]|uniref:polysaccharide deacetylase family protein n=1 Tax=Bordetella sp. N TaxID=1746199 RepID=UPI00070CB10D|nr:polysaccharide deacetylase family protein [Bordetella sp. N]ALM82240.1 polysaccharide deacetylase [Bordetella sp. N]